MFVRILATCLALLGPPMAASGTGLASSSVDQILSSEQVPIVSLPLPDFDKPLVAIAGQREEPLAAELLGITEFPLLDCPRCDETVFLDRTSPFSYIRRLSSAHTSPAIEDIALAGADSDGPGPSARFGYTIRFHPKLASAAQESKAEKPAGAAALESEISHHDAQIAPAVQLTVILLCGGGLIGMCCLVLAAERTRFHPRNARPRPAFDAEPAVQIPPSGPRPPWRCFLILGVSPGSSLEEIKHAYREKAFFAHPDRGGNAEKFLELTSAFEEAIAYATTYQLMMAESRRQAGQTDGRNGSAQPSAER